MILFTNFIAAIFLILYRYLDIIGRKISKVQSLKMLCSNIQSQAPSTGAGSQGWSSFSDISNAISPAASCDSVDVSWKESETEADLLTSRGNPETDCSLNVPLTSVSTVKYQFDPATARVLQNVPTPSTEGICYIV